jgi:hypothetical protein
LFYLKYEKNPKPAKAADMNRELTIKSGSLPTRSLRIPEATEAKSWTIPVVTAAR